MIALPAASTASDWPAASSPAPEIVARRAERRRAGRARPRTRPPRRPGSAASSCSWSQLTIASPWRRDARWTDRRRAARRRPAAARRPASGAARRDEDRRALVLLAAPPAATRARRGPRVAVRADGDRGLARVAVGSARDEVLAAAPAAAPDDDHAQPRAGRRRRCGRSPPTRRTRCRAGRSSRRARLPRAGAPPAGSTRSAAPGAHCALAA